MQRRRSETFDSLLGSSMNGGLLGGNGKPLILGQGGGGGYDHGGGSSSSSKNAKVYVASSKPLPVTERFPSAISEVASVSIEDNG